MTDNLAPLCFAPPAVRDAVRGRLRPFQVAKGRTVVGVATRSTDVFFVVEGEMQALLYSSNGREVSVRQIGQGDLFGELAALDDLPRTASVVAAADSRLLQMSRSDFLLCLESSPTAAMWLARRLGSEVRRLTERVFELSALNVQARLHCELLRLAKTGMGVDTPMVIEPAPTHAELANRIGTHREAVTREMRALVQRKIIRAGRRSLEFVDLPRLEHAVGQAVGDLLELHHAR
jgi:CRP/FNR family cyclic AMP-dependent transcriptional regulator